MKKTIEEHLKNIRENVPGLRTAEMTQRIISEVTNDVRIKAEQQNKPMPTVVISQEHIASVMRTYDVVASVAIRTVDVLMKLQNGKNIKTDDQATKDIVAIVRAVLDAEKPAKRKKKKG